VTGGFIRDGLIETVKDLYFKDILLEWIRTGGRPEKTLEKIRREFSEDRSYRNAYEKILKVRGLKREDVEDYLDLGAGAMTYLKWNIFEILPNLKKIVGVDTIEDNDFEDMMRIFIRNYGENKTEFIEDDVSNPELWDETMSDKTFQLITQSHPNAEMTRGWNIDQFITYFEGIMGHLTEEGVYAYILSTGEEELTEREKERGLINGHEALMGLFEFVGATKTITSDPETHGQANRTYVLGNDELGQIVSLLQRLKTAMGDIPPQAPGHGNISG